MEETLWMGADAEVEGEINADGDMARKDVDTEKKKTFIPEKEYPRMSACVCLNRF